MKPPRPSNVTALALLLLLIILVAIVPQDAVTGLVEAALVALLAAELDRSGRHFGLAIVRAAARLLPRRLRKDLTSEWCDCVLAAGESGMRPVFVALSLAFTAAPRLAFRYRIRFHLGLATTSVLIAYLGPWEAMLTSAVSVTKGRLSPDAVDAPPETQAGSAREAMAELDFRTRMATFAVVMAIGTFAAPNVPIGLVWKSWARRPARVLISVGFVTWVGLAALAWFTDSPAVIGACGFAWATATAAALGAFALVLSDNPRETGTRLVRRIIGPSSAPTDA